MLKQEYQNKKLTYMEYEAMSENLSGLIMVRASRCNATMVQ